MAATTVDLDIVERCDPSAMVHERVCAGTANYFKGAMIAIDYGVAGAPFIRATAADLNARVVGRCEESKSLAAINSTGIMLKVKSGIFLYDGVTVGTADVGKPCYVIDDHTVSCDAGATVNPVAGRVYEVVGSGAKVWVKFDPFTVNLGATAGA